jgi:AcrR family transcriptional regulator
MHGDAYRHGPDQTRCRLLDAAEKLFAENGFEATSVRDLTNEAECNVAAVNYHYGGKENLYQEMFRRLLGEHREQRIRRIRADLQAAGDEVSLEVFLESFARSFLEPMVDGGRGNRLMAIWDREMHDHHLPPALIFDELIRPMMRTTASALASVGEPIDPGHAQLCMMSVVGQLIHTLKMKRMLEGSGDLVPLSLDLDSHVGHIVRFSAAGIRAYAAQGGDHGS